MNLLAEILKGLTLAGAATDAAQSLVTSFLPLLSDEDQATAKEGLADARAENNEGHERLQAKLAAAAQQG